jgi:hypothetical protein
MTNDWDEFYRDAILETDWTKIEEKLQAAEREIRERQRVLSLDHGGTAEERQRIANAIHVITNLKIETGQWKKRQLP